CSLAHPHLHSFLHDALPICWLVSRSRAVLAPRRSSQLTTARGTRGSSSTPVYSTGTSRWTTPVVSRRLCGSSSAVVLLVGTALRDRKSTRLNSSHVKISYAV